MSGVQTVAPTFFELYSRGDIAANSIEDFVSQWHASGDDEERSLAAFLGLSDEEYAVLLMDPDALPHILHARRTGKQLDEVMEQYVAAPQRAGRGEDRSALMALCHWLQDRRGQ